MNTTINVAPTTIIIFGGTGDLAKRKLFPAFYNLFLDGKMPEQFNIAALGRRDKNSQEFRDYVKENILLFSRNKITSEEKWNEFQEKIVYIKNEIEVEESYVQLAGHLDAFDESYGKRGNRLYYLSIAPDFIEPISRNIKKTGLASLPDQDRIIVEKPFGHDKASAIELNNLLSSTFEEKQLYRIDHYLGKETVQNILTFRFGNSIFEPLWSNKHIESIQITVAEEVGVESRGGFYEGTGALKDMIQNHLMQVLCMIAIEPPKSLDADEVRDRKVDVLRAIRRITDDQVEHYAVRGQYSEGVSKAGKQLKAYREEDGVASDSITETFAALKFYIDNERWQGVPFYMRTGKRLKEKQSYIVINFKPLPHSTFAASGIQLAPNRLIINIQPEMDIRLQFMTKKTGISMALKPAEMIFDYFSCQEDTPEAYETLLMDAILGDLTLFMRSDLVEESWDVVDTIRRNWEDNTVDFPNYSAGSWGPKEAELLVERQGHEWSSNIKYV
jgi:glucose-6-phosphate 1-dehydrogenase